ncbi:MAG: zinc-binding dehydrogenase [Gordonia sp. (in: high G+C Gram-positive bacteria)]|uniref:quinone oxidoreductase family protein n=1 Tax=Gordonia sp. (in: high G+C Gram-positive bacteria) TaxID=84139 RepID=UPI0039E70879
MRALVGGVGPSWVLGEVPRPTPGPGQVVIRNRAAATNNADLGVLRAADPASGGTGERYVAGYEYAGEVAAVGAGVDSWQVGDPVMGTTPESFAEFVVADHRFVLPRNGLAPEVACALPTGLLTEHGALAAAGFTAGQTVLITGASTGIGLIGCQLVKALGGAAVIGTTRTPAKAATLRAAGVDTVVLVPETDLTRAVLDATGGDGVDVVLDHLGGSTFAACLPATKQFGHVVNIGRLAGAPSTVDLYALSYRNLTVHGVSFGFSRPDHMAGVIAGLLPAALPAAERGEVRPVIDCTAPWSDPDRIQDRLDAPDLTGKVVVTLD